MTTATAPLQMIRAEINVNDFHRWMGGDRLLYGYEADSDSKPPEYPTPAATGAMAIPRSPGSARWDAPLQPARQAGR